MATERTPPPEDDDDFDRLPDAAEADTRHDAESDAAPVKHRGRAISFLRASVAELRRVDWPDRRHTFQATAVVLGFVVIAGAWLGLADAIFKPLMEAII